MAHFSEAGRQNGWMFQSMLGEKGAAMVEKERNEAIRVSSFELKEMVFLW